MKKQATTQVSAQSKSQRKQARRIAKRLLRDAVISDLHPAGGVVHHSRPKVDKDGVPKYGRASVVGSRIALISYKG
jgi:hypothetical protein